MSIRTNMTLASAVACVVLLFGSQSALALDKGQMKLFQASKGKIASVQKQKTFAVIQSRATKDQQDVAAKGRSASGKRVTVIVDGVMIEMNEGMVDALIRGGVFKVVWAGTNIPVDPFRPIWY